MVKEDNETDSIFEMGDSEYVLNLEFYLHRSILKWLDALESALRMEKGIDTGLTNRGLAGDMVIGIAKAKGIIHWTEIPVPKKDDKHKQNVLKWNQEAKDFKEKLDKFKSEINKDIPPNMKNVKITDFRVFEVLRMISSSSSKKGVVIV